MLSLHEIISERSSNDIDQIVSEYFDELFEYYLPFMPYGTAKARDGDPMQWISERLAEDFSHIKF